MAAASSKQMASWKFDMLNALMLDISPSEFVVAYCLLQHANDQTRAIFPSQRRIALLLNVSTSTVERAVSKLVGRGWLERSRYNRQRSNSYSFSDARAAAMTYVRMDREVAWRAERDPAKMTGQKKRDPANLTALDPAEMKGTGPADLTGKHLKGTPEGNTLTVGHDSYDLSVEQYARAVADGVQVAPRPLQAGSKQPFPAPAPKSVPFKPLRAYVEPNFDRIEAENVRRRKEPG